MWLMTPLVLPSRRQRELEGLQAGIIEQLMEAMEKESLSQNTLDSVLRVYCTHVQPSQSQPWQKIPQVSSTSSGEGSLTEEAGNDL